MLAVRLRLALQTRLVDEYQPDPFAPPGERRRDPRRSDERFAAFDAHLPAGVPLSVLDVGCNEGFFLFNLARRGGICLGVDQDLRGIMIGRSRATVHEVGNVAFARMAVDHDNVVGLPRADVVLCLSVFHHWVRYLGLDEAQHLLRAVASRADGSFVFETGQPNETGAKWTDALGFMGPDPEAWVRQTLLDLGFDRVEMVGRFPTTVSPVARALFVASRSSGTP
ncbi:MAG TPA: methyltransferase [Egicoccus sp.]|nr:methyltransferase [Egicoccus sp.]HSK21602.1 methyltransferase [Egicoccus sp.]